MVNGNGIFGLLGKMTLRQDEERQRQWQQQPFLLNLSWILVEERFLLQAASNLKSNFQFQLYFLLISNPTFLLWISKMLLLSFQFKKCFFSPLDSKNQFSFTFCFPIRSSSLNWQLKSVNTWKMVISLYIGFVKHWSKVYDFKVKSCKSKDIFRF